MWVDEYHLDKGFESVWKGWRVWSFYDKDKMKYAVEGPEPYGSTISGFRTPEAAKTAAENLQRIMDGEWDD